MEPRSYDVPDVSCEHCVSAITAALAPLPEVSGVEVDLEAKVVTVSPTADARLDDAAVLAAIDEAGYDATVR